jgi:hypothetical protein
MLELLIVIGRAVALALSGHRELVLENLALRQQLTVMRRTTNRPHLATCDRLLWIGLARIWPNWRTALVLVQTANPLWGAPRIHGELRILGVDISERTVSRLLERHPRPPSQTWKTFLSNHLASAASMDFFTVSTLTGRRPSSPLRTAGGVTAQTCRRTRGGHQCSVSTYRTQLLFASR